MFLPGREGLRDKGWLYLEPIALTIESSGFFTFRNSQTDAVFTGMNHAMPGGSEPLIVTVEQYTHSTSTTTTHELRYTTRSLTGAIVSRWTMPLDTDSSAYAYGVKLNVTSDGLHIVTLCFDNGYLSGGVATIYRHSLTGTLEGTYSVSVPSNARYSHTSWDTVRARDTQATSAFGFVYFAVPHYARDIILIAMADDMSRLSSKSVYFTYDVVMPTPGVSNFCLMPYALGVTVMWKGVYGYPNTIPSTVPWAYWARWQLKFTSGSLGAPQGWGFLPGPTTSPTRTALGYPAIQDDYGQVLAGCVDIDVDESNRNGNTQAFIISGYEDDSAALGVLTPVDPSVYPRYDGTTVLPDDYFLQDYYGTTVGVMHQYDYDTNSDDYQEFGGPPPFSPSLQPLAPNKLLHTIRTYQGIAMGIITTKQIDDGERPGVVPGYWPDVFDSEGEYTYPQPMVNPHYFIRRGDVDVPSGYNLPGDTTLTYDDSFDRPDNDYIEGPFYWTVCNDDGSYTDANWGISDGMAYALSSVDNDNNAVGFLEVESPSQDVTATFGAVGTNHALALRLNPDDSVLTYWYFYFGTNAGYMFKTGTSNGAFTLVPAMTCSAGDTVRITASGNTFTVYRNGVEVAQFTNALNNDATAVGMAGIPLDTTTRIDHFKVIATDVEPFFRAWGDSSGIVLTDPWRQKAYMYSSQSAQASMDQIQRMVDGIRVFEPYVRHEPFSVTGPAASRAKFLPNA